MRCVPITVPAGWLTQLVEQRRRRTRDTAAVVLEFCDLVEAALKSLAPADASGGSAQEGQDSQDSGALKGRAALGLDDDSDEDVLATADTGSTSIKVNKSETGGAGLCHYQSVRLCSDCEAKVPRPGVVDAT